jgi:hypothetical protein
VDTGEARYSLRPVVNRQTDRTRRFPTAAAIALSQAGILVAACSWKDVEAERFKRYIGERRTTSNRLPT